LFEVKRVQKIPIESYIKIYNIILYTYRKMAEKLTREQLKGLTAEEKIEYQRKQNAARVAAYRANKKEKAAEYNRTCKKDCINRPENREKYKELNKQYVARHNKQKSEVLLNFEVMKANKNAEKLNENAKNARELREEGKAIIRRINKRMEKKNLFYFCYFISLHEREPNLKWEILIYNYPITYLTIIYLTIIY
jgi:hypothetical protein